MRLLVKIPLACLVAVLGFFSIMFASAPFLADYVLEQNEIKQQEILDAVNKARQIEAEHQKTQAILSGEYHARQGQFNYLSCPPEAQSGFKPCYPNQVSP